MNITTIISNVLKLIPPKDIWGLRSEFLDVMKRYDKKFFQQSPEFLQLLPNSLSVKNTYEDTVLQIIQSTLASIQSNIINGNLSFCLYSHFLLQHISNLPPLH